MNMNKRIILPIFALSAGILVGCKQNSGTDTVVNAKLVYESGSSGLTITGVSNKISEVTNIDVPERIDGKKVTSIKEGAFKGASNVKSMSLPFVGSKSENCNGKEGLLGYLFGDQDFENATKINQICDLKYDETKGKYIRSYSAGCIPNSLREIKITGSQAEVPLGAFSYCNYLEKVDLSGTNIYEINPLAFAYCDKLTSCIFPEDLVYVDGGAFYDCESLTDLTFPKNVSDIGANAFSYCFSLHDVVFKSDAVTLREEAFSYCNTHRNFLVSNYVNDLPVFYFTGSVDFEDEDGYTLEPCQVLTPDVKNTGADHDVSSGYEKNVYYPYVENYIEGSISTDSNGFNYCVCQDDSNKTAHITRYVGNDSKDLLTVPANLVNHADASGTSVPVCSIENFAFIKNNNVKTVDIKSSNLNYIGGYILCDSNIESVELPSDLDKKISKFNRSAFMYSNLSSLRIPGNVTADQIDYYTFRNYSELIGNYVSYNTIIFEENSKYNPTSNTNLLPQWTNDIGSITFGSGASLNTEGLRYLLNNIGYTKLTNLDLGKNSKVEKIQNNQFRSVEDYFTKLTLNEGSSLTAIGNYAFGRINEPTEENPAPLLSSIDLENATNLASIGDYAFGYCTNLKYVTLPSSLFTAEAWNGKTAISNTAFYGWDSNQIIKIKSSKYNVEERFRNQYKTTYGLEYPVTFVKDEGLETYHVKPLTSGIQPVFGNATIIFDDNDPTLYNIKLSEGYTNSVTGRGDLKFAPNYAFNLQLVSDDTESHPYPSSSTNIVIDQDGTSIEGWTYDSSTHIISFTNSVISFGADLNIVIS